MAGKSKDTNMTNKITKDTPAQIVELANTLLTAADALSERLKELSLESDAQLKLAAAALSDLKKDWTYWNAHPDARRKLIEAACAASDIDELLVQINHIRGKCSYLTHIELGKTLKKGNIQSVCEKTGSTEG